MKTHINLILFLLSGSMAFSQTSTLTGRVLSALDGASLQGATITSGDGRFMSKTDIQGYFQLNVDGRYVEIQVTHLGFLSDTLKIELPSDNSLVIRLRPLAKKISEVTISTGYEDIPLQRATGSFDLISSELVNRSVAPDILSRIENLSTGLHFERSNMNFNRPGRPEHQLYMHGISSLRGGGSNAPLIILDNFPYHGDPNTINPNEIESVAILKDAAATSVWGARAGNGVIVITSKHSDYMQPVRINFSSNFSMVRKPNLFAYQNIKSADLIDVETFLFEQGYYDRMETNRAKPALPPAVEVLIGLRDGTMSATDAEKALDRLKKQDVRNDMLDYVYRNATAQQYALSLQGGGNRNKFILSAGYDKSLENIRGNHNNRLSLRAANTLRLSKAIELSGQLRWSTNSAAYHELGDSYFSYTNNGYKYPYVSFVDDNGNHNAIPRDYRVGFVDTAGADRLLDWRYRPLDELDHPVGAMKSSELLANIMLVGDVTDWLTLKLQYQYQGNSSLSQRHRDLNNYETRDQINRGTTLENGTIIYNYPFGGTLHTTNGTRTAHQGRFQANFNRQWKMHEVHGLTGMEIQEAVNNSGGYSVYGYDEQLLTHATNVDHIKRYPVYADLASTDRVPYPVQSFSGTNIRFVSIYGNASYVYSKRYTATVSARKDASNLFGVETNNKWTPLWSLGLAWNVHNERFFNLTALSRLKLRVTYGYSGNVDNSMSGYTTYLLFQ